MANISNRIGRIERLADERLRPLLRTDEELEHHYDQMQRMADYVGFPVPTKAAMVEQWRGHDAQTARLMITEGHSVESAAVAVFCEATRYAETVEGATAWLERLNELRRAVLVDMELGIPGSESEAGRQLAAHLMQ